MTLLTQWSKQLPIRLFRARWITLSDLPVAKIPRQQGRSAHDEAFFAANTFEVELSRLETAPGEWVRIYTPTRTVIDLMRLRHRFGESLALAAMRRYLRRRDVAPAELLRLASMFDVAGPVRRALDVATAE
jgi:hypothetical protein